MHKNGLIHCKCMCQVKVVNITSLQKLIHHALINVVHETCTIILLQTQGYLSKFISVFIRSGPFFSQSRSPLASLHDAQAVCCWNPLHEDISSHCSIVIDIEWCSFLLYKMHIQYCFYMSVCYTCSVHNNVKHCPLRNHTLLWSPHTNHNHSGLFMWHRMKGKVVDSDMTS